MTAREPVVNPGRDPFVEALKGVLNGFLVIFSIWFVLANLWLVAGEATPVVNHIPLARLGELALPAAAGPLPPPTRAAPPAPAPASPQATAAPIEKEPSRETASSGVALAAGATGESLGPATLVQVSVKGGKAGYILKLDFDRPVILRTSYQEGAGVMEMTIFPVHRAGLAAKVPPLSFLESVTDSGSGHRAVLRLQVQGAFSPRAPLPVGEAASFELVFQSGAPRLGLPPGAILNRLSRRPLQEGLVEERYRYKPSGRGGSDVYLLEFDPEAGDLELGVTRGRKTMLGKQTCSSMVAAADAVAGLNASFFSRNGDPLGLLAEGGVVLSKPLLARGVLGSFDGGRRVLVGNPGYSGRVDFEGGNLRIDGVNQVRKPNKVILYTPAWGPRTGNPGGGLEMAVEGGRILSLSDGNSEIPANGYVVAVQDGPSERALARLGTGERVTLVSGLTPPWNRADFAIGGGPVLLKDGRRIVAWREESFSRTLAVTPAPRTAVGIRSDGRMLLMVVDGRRAGVNRGVDLHELADILAELGCRDALNLDGGGSSTLVHGGKVQNRPSDGRERAISTALVIRPRVSRTKEAPPVLAAAASRRERRERRAPSPSQEAPRVPPRSFQLPARPSPRRFASASDEIPRFQL